MQDLSASWALPLSPAAIAARTRFICVRVVVRTCLLRSVILMVWRARFWDETWLATDETPESRAEGGIGSPPPPGCQAALSLLVGRAAYIHQSEASARSAGAELL